MIHKRILCAGFGGQGVMSLGQLLAYAGMLEDRHVTWLPSYGPEMRGGTAYCSVIVSETPIGSPIVVGSATCAIVMNLPSLLKFEAAVRPGGLLLLNSSLISQKPTRSDLQVVSLSANDLAVKSGQPRAANMVMLGAYLAITEVVARESVTKAFAKVFGTKAEKFLPQSLQAMERGAEAALLAEAIITA